ncbi:MAG: C-methyltransferase [Candidatus Collierbacteria bacterium GW2011_GWB1_44_6]|uniref:C-methyltransferase n=2 Tax=Candidatus Collieribacteriota TaxID=1752725 RepID=A0A0G1LY56_9BACT|nr:MAG: C-methyltransferase [Candidatus Collierbacteria bacterium GW2011_GWC2_43_12]KKT73767.1 MAG: C-methyltransferase [Candidatus Collierbacteria bacterium GW2011_GWB1_44_6]KKT83919.1 MAG: C-methyltransferase [Microgenomates group bacterium GW2011_GWC1_44_9]
MLYREITECRICGNKNIYKVVELGETALSGVFPKADEEVEKGPLTVVKCDDRDGISCGLLQLAHNYLPEKLYGDNYGYRSGLNRSMVAHLQELANQIKNKIELKKGDLILDIGSNDGTLLSQYGVDGVDLVGIDPTIKKFGMYYQRGITKIPDFFSSEVFKKEFGERKAKVVTSVAMFYDLEHPIDFMAQVYEILDDEGVWVLEQSYMPRMIDNVSYDTICHEHLEYYAIRQISWMVSRIGMKIVDIELNETNGASFKVFLAKKNSRMLGNEKMVRAIIEAEEARDLQDPQTYEDFNKAIFEHREGLVNFIKKVHQQGKTIYGYGASTKGNVILQFAGLDKKDLPAIAEVNEYKYGRFAPGTDIEIKSETEIKALKPDYLLVLPWHFKDNIIGKEQAYLDSGGHLVFPLPKIEVV